MAPAALKQGSTSTNSPEPSIWHIIALLFIGLFIFTLLLSALFLRRLHRSKKRLEAQISDADADGGSSSSSPLRDLSPSRRHGPHDNNNPHPFGTDAWRQLEDAWRQLEDARLTRAEQDALALADLEAQVAMLEEAGGYLDRSVALLEARNRELSLELAEERRRYEPVDPEVMRRVYEDMHRPAPAAPVVEQPPAPTPNPTPNPGPRPERAAPALQLTMSKVHGIMERSAHESPERTTQVVNVLRPERSLSATVAEDPFADGPETT